MQAWRMRFLALTLSTVGSATQKLSSFYALPAEIATYGPGVPKHCSWDWHCRLDFYA